MTDVRPGPARRRPPQGRPVPVSTYRLQLNADFTFDDAAAQVPYVARLGATHLYLSPVLTAAPGSTHGYDVVDHDAISAALGGEDGLRRLHAAAREHGLGLVVDVVPNHMAVPTPVWHNHALWSVLAHGPESPFAAWFDVDWSAGDGALLMPVLGRRLGAVLAADELSLDTAVVPGSAEPQPVLRYWDHVFPVRPGTESLPLAELVDRQHYRLAYWRVANEELNYRRFFDVGTLAAVRVEDPEVFDATHRLLAGLVADGTVDGLRIDHPDGLADPQGYLDRLAAATDDAWVVVEKILAPTEELPEDWATAGTTGYDAMWRIEAAFVDPGGGGELGAVMHRLTGDTTDALPGMIDEAKREIVGGPLYAEVDRLAGLAADICRDDVRLRDHTRRSLQDCLVELLVAADRYRYYVAPGRPVHPDSAAAFAECVQRARGHLEGDRLETLDLLAEMLLGHEIGSAGRTREPRRDELIVRFQQVCGAVMAKGVEDTAFYRWTHLLSLAEVGGAPERFAISPEELHAFALRAQQHAPVAMTGLSTHDTKRSEDVRSRLAVLSELPVEWSELVDTLRAATADLRPSILDGRTENILWQTLAGTWDDDGPIDADRLTEYLTKAVREAKSRTTWTTPDEAYEQAVLDLARQVRDLPAVHDAYTGWLRRTAPGVRATTLGTKLVQLTMPGVADVYQGTEVPAIALVDPDNRRPVDYAALSRSLERLEEQQPRGLADEKLLVTSRALRARRRHPEAFVGESAGYQPLPSSSGHALAFARTSAGEPQVVTVATRLALALDRLGGWGDHTVALPEGAWHDALSGREVAGGLVPLAELLGTAPVALLVRPGQA
ncbi:maltooligosyl trehalose synthase [Actinotalea ferrariae CF5-4]|uniref:Maltooligosyl trehalose synthase n=1 Tax=Actinotalea ferrariae CF5-4 TaxID=948458 RepID=A0A021VPW4_9CELL|nr:malto-oligosyltrehalose synthase [Actinotalea ferrariae]EYR63158.1 maltooligosyl trehalose synthase [Actinotalea ferrariae CF5-4]